MELGFETIGNATLICHDRRPVLAAAPRLGGSAYFGSWALAHVVPEEHQQAVRSCRYLWISHGYPDHLHFPSLESLREKEILVPITSGGRIARPLVERGFEVRILPDATWTSLFDRIGIAVDLELPAGRGIVFDDSGRRIRPPRGGEEAFRGGSRMSRAASASLVARWSAPAGRLDDPRLCETAKHVVTLSCPPKPNTQ